MLPLPGLLPAIFPGIITWSLPPDTDMERRRTQRRSTPLGKQGAFFLDWKGFLSLWVRGDGGLTSFKDLTMGRAVVCVSSGYPHQPSQNDVLQEKRRQLEDEKEKRDLSGRKDKMLRLLELDDDQVRQLTLDQLDTLWSPTFDWRSRVYCFLTAPYVLFLLNSILVCPRTNLRYPLSLHGRPVFCHACHGSTYSTAGCTD